MRATPISRAHGIGRAIAVAGGIIIAAITLTPSGDSSRNLHFWCLTCGVRPAVDILLNVILFVPLGIGLGLSGLRRRRVLLLALLLTAAIEFLQWSVIPGRYPSFRDIITNSFGALIGFELAVSWRTALRPSSRAARALVAFAVIAWLMIQSFGAWAVGLDAPPTPWWVQLRPAHDRFPIVFAGRVLEASIGTRVFPESDQIENPESVRQELVSGAEVRAKVSAAPPTAGLAPILIISAGPLRDVALLAQSGEDAVCQMAMRGSTVGLQTPAFLLPAALRGAAARDVVTIGCRYSKGWLRLDASGAAGAATRSIRASPSWTWVLLVPIANYAFESELFILTALWLVAAGGVLGYWAGRGMKGTESKVLLAVVVALGIALGLAAVPATFGLAVAPLYEWLAAAGGALAGFAAARVAANAYSSTSARSELT